MGSLDRVWDLGKVGTFNPLWVHRLGRGIVIVRFLKIGDGSMLGPETNWHGSMMRTSGSNLRYTVRITVFRQVCPLELEFLLREQRQSRLALNAGSNSTLWTRFLVHSD